MESGAKREIYRRLLAELAAVLPGTGDTVAAMSTSACLIHRALPYASWAGFYRVVGPGVLRVGPYQGPLGCLEIPFERGVCGAAARTRQIQLAADVHGFPGHIACDESARSEIVVPIFDGEGELVAVLDLDSRDAAAFDDVDREALQEVAELLRPHVG